MPEPQTATGRERPAERDARTVAESVNGRDARGHGDPDRTRRIELELRRVRCQAAAARLEARAAQLEWMLYQASTAEELSSSSALDLPDAPAAESVSRPETSYAGPIQSHADPPGIVEGASAADGLPRIQSWTDLEAGMRRRMNDRGESRSEDRYRFDSGDTAATGLPKVAPEGKVTPEDKAAPEDKAGTAKKVASVPQKSHPRKRTATPDPSDDLSIASDKERSPSAAPLLADASLPCSPLPLPSNRPAKRPATRSATRPAPELVKVSRCDQKTNRRKRPAPWFFSAIAHAAVLVLLAGLTLSIQVPRDQIAMQASAVKATEANNLQQVELSEPTLSESQAETVLDRPTEVETLLGPPAASLASPLLDAADAAAATAIPSADTAELVSKLQSTSEPTSQFCGVDGGGNHFVYIVDSSQSMQGGRFESARRELFQAIESLQSEQRFYVIFYDSQMERMCLAEPNAAEQYSVCATPENKQALQRWAMRVKLERGAPPDDALEFALTLRPDVIFLLSDGEFPERIETLLSTRNRNINLFGDMGPISTVHTIGYHSREGEIRMRRIAEKNGGQYRYIAPPK